MEGNPTVMARLKGPNGKHKQYKDLQNIQLNLRKTKSIGGRQTKHHPNLNITYPSLNATNGANNECQRTTTIVNKTGTLAKDNNYNVSMEPSSLSML
jgi:hypothetical protein